MPGRFGGDSALALFPNLLASLATVRLLTTIAHQGNGPLVVPNSL